MYDKCDIDDIQINKYKNKFIAQLTMKISRWGLTTHMVKKVTIPK